MINMDETSLYLDSPLYVSYSQIGERRVPAVTSGSEMVRVPVAFSTLAFEETEILVLITSRKARLFASLFMALFVALFMAV